jgi:hypothetical protein
MRTHARMLLAMPLAISMCLLLLQVRQRQVRSESRGRGEPLPPAIGLLSPSSTAGADRKVEDVEGGREHSGSTARAKGSTGGDVEAKPAASQATADLFEYPVAHPGLCGAESDNAVLGWAESLDAQVNHLYLLARMHTSYLKVCFVALSLSSASARMLSLSLPLPLSRYFPVYHAGA